MFASVDATMEQLARAGYQADRDTATGVFLSLELAKPLFVEGQPGTGKSSLALAIAASLEAPLVRLRCFAGMDPERACYSWDYAGRLGSPDSSRACHSDFLIPGPLLRAIRNDSDTAPVLLVEGLERAGAPFASFLAGFIDDPSVAIPGGPRLYAAVAPRIVVTWNGASGDASGVREQSQYAWLDFPRYERQEAIIRRRVPGISPALSGEICNVVGAIRNGGFRQAPGIGEAIDWGRSLVALHRASLDQDIVDETLGCILKHPADIARFRRQRLFERVVAEHHIDVKA